MKQRFRKTPMSQRKVYKYYDANERCVATIHPGDDNQVSEIHIKILHSMDDAEVNNNRKKQYHGTCQRKSASWCYVKI